MYIIIGSTKNLNIHKDLVIRVHWKIKIPIYLKKIE